jgi:hypothetical protein
VTSPLARAALLALAPSLLLGAAGATAQDTPRAGEIADILGYWVFEAAPTYPGCHLYGEVNIAPGPTPDSFQCSMIANDVCPDIWRYRAEQVCTATRKRDRLVITSTIESVEPSTGNYLPDNFLLTIVDGSRMVGELRSAIDAPAEFRRGEAPIS